MYECIAEETRVGGQSGLRVAPCYCSYTPDTTGLRSRESRERTGAARSYRTQPGRRAVLRGFFAAEEWREPAGYLEVVSRQVMTTWTGARAKLHGLFRAFAWVNALD